MARDGKAGYQGGQTNIFNYIMAIEAEAHRAALALELAKTKGFRYIVLEGDSLTIINT